MTSAIAWLDDMAKPEQKEDLRTLPMENDMFWPTQASGLRFYISWLLKSVLINWNPSMVGKVATTLYP